MYSLTIRVEGIERRKKGTGLFHIVAGLFLLVNASEYFIYNGYRNLLTVMPFFLVAVLSLLYGFFRNKWDQPAKYNHWVRMLQVVMFAVLGILMLESNLGFRAASLFIWSVACVLLLFTERKVFHDAHLRFTNASITIPGYFYNKTIPWSVISDIIIRPDFVTIYYPNNKYLQYELLHEVKSHDIEQINAYCKQQLKQSASTTQINS